MNMVEPHATPLPQLLLTATQLGQLLRGCRKQRGLTQAQVGARLGLSQNRVSYLEGHPAELSVRQLLTWCAVVGLELSLAPRPAQPGAKAGAAGTHVATEAPEW